MESKTILVGLIIGLVIGVGLDRTLAPSQDTSNYESQINQLTSQVSSLQNEVDDLEEELDGSISPEDYDELTEHAIELRSQISFLSAEVNSKESTIISLQSQISALDELIEEQVDVLSELNSEYDSFRSLYNELNTSYYSLINSYSQLLSQCNDTDVEYGDVTAQQAKNLIDSKPNLIIIDVRTLLEYETGHIEGSINICVTSFPEQLFNTTNPNDEILLYCKTGMRSANALQITQENGYLKVYNMVGGIEAWKSAGYPIIES